MQLMPTTFDTVNNDAAYTDYLPQENVISNFSNELDSAMAEAQYENNMPMDKESEDKVFGKEAKKSSPYSERAEIYSFFAPQEPRFNTEELMKLAKAFQNDDISIEAQNALASLMNTPTGPTLKELLSTLTSSIKGGNVALDTNEIAQLQNLAGRTNPEQPTMLYDSIRYKDALSGMTALISALKQNPTTLSQDELSALAKSFNLSEDMQMGMQKTLAQFDKNRPLSATQVDAIFDEAKALLQSKNDEFAKMKKSLEQNLKPLYESAQKREESDRRALMQQNKDVMYSKTVIEDTIVTKVLGKDLNRDTVNGKKLSEKDGQNKSAMAQPSAQSSAQPSAQSLETEQNITAKKANSLSDEDVLAETKQENTLIANKVLDERTADAKAEDKLFADKEEVRTQEKEQMERFGFDKQNNEQANSQNSREDFSRDARSDSRNEERHSETASSMAGAMAVQSGAGFDAAQTNFAENLENIRSQVQDTVLTMMKNGTKRLEVSLNPLELGQMAVVLTMKGGEVNAVIQADKAESASLINQQLETIRAELEHQGFKVENIEVEVGLSDNFSNQTAQNWEGMQQHNSEQTFRENLQNLNYLRALSRKNSSSDMNAENSLAHNMHITGSIVAGKENSSLQGLHIIA